MAFTECDPGEVPLIGQAKTHPLAATNKPKGTDGARQGAEAGSGHNVHLHPSGGALRKDATKAAHSSQDTCEEERSEQVHEQSIGQPRPTAQTQ